jgi:hypothetical protein
VKNSSKIEKFGNLQKLKTASKFEKFVKNLKKTTVFFQIKNVSQFSAFLRNNRGHRNPKEEISEITL